MFVSHCLLFCLVTAFVELITASNGTNTNRYSRGRRLMKEIKETSKLRSYLQEAENKCPLKKRIILDVSKSGLGNRLLALVSASVLAASMDRVLELKWDKTAKCGSYYDELFDVKGTKKLVKFVPFIYGQDHPAGQITGEALKLKKMLAENSVHLNQTVCDVDFNRNTIKVLLHPKPNNLLLIRYFKFVCSNFLYSSTVNCTTNSKKNAMSSVLVAHLISRIF